MAAATAAYELLNVGFGLRPLSAFTPSTTCSAFGLQGARKLLRNEKIHRFVSCSLVNKQQSMDQVSFSEDENLLIEALIGIQGRGRSASPQQLQVIVFFEFPI